VLLIVVKIKGKRGGGGTKISLRSSKVGRASGSRCATLCPNVFLQPETLIALGLRPRHLVLVGDVKQLAPTVKSLKAIEHRLDWSLLWRLQVRNQSGGDLSPSGSLALPPRAVSTPDSNPLFPYLGGSSGGVQAACASSHDAVPHA
jgi:hypothetical protein